MVYFRSCVAYSTFAVFKAHIQIFTYIVCFVKQCIFRRHIPMKTELYQVCYKVLCRCHIDIGQRKPFAVVTLDVVPRHVCPDKFRLMPAPQCNVTNDSEYLSSLVGGDPATVIQSQFYTADMLLYQFPFNVFGKFQQQLIAVLVKFKYLSGRYHLYHAPCECAYTHIRR